MLTDMSKPAKQNSDTDTNVSKSAIASTDALGEIRVANAAMLPSKLLYRG
jgi:hypothetical protein